MLASANSAINKRIISLWLERESEMDSLDFNLNDPLLVFFFSQFFNKILIILFFLKLILLLIMKCRRAKIVVMANCVVNGSERRVFFWALLKQNNGSGSSAFQNARIFKNISTFYSIPPPPPHPTPNINHAFPITNNLFNWAPLSNSIKCFISFFKT